MRVLPLWFALALLASAAGPEFEFSPDSVATRVWGGDWGRPLRHHFDERLPALFERRLAISRLEPGEGRLEWIFTGPRGGFTIALRPDSVQIIERAYDSFALNEAKPERHPERVTGRQTIPRHRPPESVTVRLDHRLSLVLLIDGEEVARRPFLLDVYHHQVAYSGQGPPAGTIRGRLSQPPAQPATLRVHPARRHQTMLGFGGIATPTAYAQLSQEGRRRWWDLLTEYNLLIQREYPNGVRLNQAMDNFDRLADSTPHYYGDNFPNGEISDFGYLDKLRSIGGQVVFEFWGLPLWARQDWTDAQGKLHPGVADPEPYARAVVQYCRLLQQHTGAPPEIVGIQNEVRQPPEIWRRMALTLRQALDDAGFSDVKIHSRDAGRLEPGIRDLRDLKQFPDAWAAIDYAASHMYDYQNYFRDPDAFDPLLREWKKLTAGRPFLSTELCVNSSRYQLDSYRIAFAMGQLYHKNLALTDAAAIMYCWLILNVEQPSYGWTRSLFVPDLSAGGLPVASSNQLRVFGAYSRRIRRGMVRVEAAASDPNLLATAFVQAARPATVVLLNRALRPLEVSLDWPGATFPYRETAGPYQPNTPHANSPGPILLAPGSIVTLSATQLPATR